MIGEGPWDLRRVLYGLRASTIESVARLSTTRASTRLYVHRRISSQHIPTQSVRDGPCHLFHLNGNSGTAPPTPHSQDPHTVIPDTTYFRCSAHRARG